MDAVQLGRCLEPVPTRLMSHLCYAIQKMKNCCSKVNLAQFQTCIIYTKGGIVQRGYESK